MVYVRNNGPSSILIPIADNKLIYADRPGTSMTFKFGVNGKNDIQWNHFTHNQTASSFQPLVLSSKELSSYAGAYYNEELEKSFDIAYRDNKLFISLGEQQMPLSPTTKDQFVGFDMFKCRFDRDSNRAIASMRLDAPRAGNIHCVRTELVK